MVGQLLVVSHVFGIGGGVVNGGGGLATTVFGGGGTTLLGGGAHAHICGGGGVVEVEQYAQSPLLPYRTRESPNGTLEELATITA